MALPNSIDAATPGGTDSPALGDDQLRALKTFLEDVFGIPDATSITAAAFSISSAGVVTVSQANTRMTSIELGHASDTTITRASAGVIAVEGVNVALVSNNLSVFAATTSAQLAGVISDETGSGALVFGTAPTITGGTHMAITSFGVRSTGTGAFDLKLTNNENLTVSDKTLTINLNNANRLLTIVGDTTLSGSNLGDQTITLTGGVTGSGTGSFAATVVTNANLTGPITSVGNATSVAAQTGTGSTFVMQASPTLTTPIFTTSITGPLLIGGTGTTSTLTLQSTSGVGTTNADIIFRVGNNGGTEGGRFINAGALVLGAAIATSAGLGDLVLPNASGEIRWVNTAGTDTIPVITVGANNVLFLKSSQTAAIADSGTLSIITNRAGLMFITENSTDDGKSAVFLLDNVANTSVEIADTGGIYSNISGTASSINVYSTGGVITVENKRGGNRILSIVYITYG